MSYIPGKLKNVGCKDYIAGFWPVSGESSVISLSGSNFACGSVGDVNVVISNPTSSDATSKADFRSCNSDADLTFSWTLPDLSETLDELSVSYTTRNGGGDSFIVTPTTSNPPSKLSHADYACGDTIEMTCKLLKCALSVKSDFLLDLPKVSDGLSEDGPYEHDINVGGGSTNEWTNNTDCSFTVTIGGSDYSGDVTGTLDDTCFISVISDGFFISSHSFFANDRGDPWSPDIGGEHAFNPPLVVNGGETLRFVLYNYVGYASINCKLVLTPKR